MSAEGHPEENRMAPRPRGADEASDSTRIGHYEVLNRLRKGGRGTVFEARDARTGRRVALKVLPPQLARDAELRERFLAEAQAATGLDHSHIVRGIEVGEARGACYFATELAEGPTLQEAIAQEARLDARSALETVGAVLLALEYALDRGLTHGGLSADAIILGTDGVVRLTGLGVARPAHEPDAPHYAAPEQARGETHLDTRTDLYALGVILYQMLAGRVPFDAPTAPAVLARHIAEPVPPLPDLSPGLRHLLERMLAKDPGQRPASPRAALDTIHDLLEGRERAPAAHAEPDVAAPQRGPAASPGREPVPGRRRLSRWLTAAAVAAAVVVVVLPLVLLRPPSEADRAAERREEAKAAYQAALKAWEASPGDLDAAARRFLDVRTTYAGTEQAGLAAAKLQELEDRLDDAAKAAYEAALEHERTHPDDMEQTLARLRDVVTRYPSTQWAEDARATIGRLETAKADLASRAERVRQQALRLGRARAACERLLAQDRFADARALVNEAAPELGQADAAALAQRVVARADARYEELARAADAALDSKDYAGARAAAQAALALGMPHLAQRAKRKLAEIASREQHADLWGRWDRTRHRARALAVAGDYEKALTELEWAKGLALDGMDQRVADEIEAVHEIQRAALEAARALYAEHSGKVWALLGERRYGEAERLLAKVEQAPAYAPVRKRLAADAEAVQLLREFWAAVERGLSGRKGSFLAFAGAGGEILRVEDGDVFLKGPKATARRPIRRLTAGQAAAYADLRDDARSRLTLGVFLLAEGAKLDEAGKALDAAGDRPAVAAYRERLAAALKPPPHPPEKPEPTPGPVAAKGRADTWHELFAQRHLGSWRAVGPALKTVRDPKRLVRVSRGGVLINVLPGKLPADPARVFEQQSIARAGVEWVGDFPTADYEVRLEAACLGGSGLFCGVAFPSGPARWSLSLAGEDTKGYVCLMPTQGAEEDAQPVRSAFRFVRGRWYQVRVRVAGNEVRAWVDGKDVRSLPALGNYSIAAPYSTEGVGRLGVGAQLTRAAVRGLRVRRLAAGAAPKPEG